MSNFTVTPDRPTLDEQVTLRATGVKPGTEVTLTVTEELHGTNRHSSATFKADTDGVVDPARQEPQSAPYEGIKPMGLFQFLPHHEGERRSTAPRDVKVVATHDAGVATDECTRIVLAPGIDRTPIEAPNIVGDVYHPPGNDPQPCVLVLGGSGGGLPPARLPALIASHGFVAVSLAYVQPMDWGSREGNVGRDFSPLSPALQEIPLEYFRDAIRVVTNDRQVQSSPVGALGFSRGGELALLLGAHLPAVRAVVGYVPSGVAWSGSGNSFRKSYGSAWSIGGEPVPHVLQADCWIINSAIGETINVLVL